MGRTRTRTKKDLRGRQFFASKKKKAQEEKEKREREAICTATAPCLICGSEYDNSISNLKRSMVTRSVEETSAAFTAFSKVLLVSLDEASSWDLSVEPLPLCVTCSPLLFQLAQLSDELDKIQLEIQEKVESIRNKISASQNGNTDSSFENTGNLAEEKDERVKRFRLNVIRGQSTGIKNELEPTDTNESAGLGLMFESSLVEEADEFEGPHEFEDYAEKVEDGDPGQYIGHPMDDTYSDSEESNESTDQEMDDEERFRKKRAAMLLHRFKNCKSSNGTTTLNMLGQIRVQPKRKASLALFKKKKSKHGKRKRTASRGSGSDSDENSDSLCSDSNESKADTNEDPEWKDHSNLTKPIAYDHDRLPGVRRSRRRPEKNPLTFEEVDGQPVYREIPILRVAEGPHFNYTCTLCSRKFRRTRAISQHIDDHIKITKQKRYEMKDGKLYYKDVEITMLEKGPGLICSLCSTTFKCKDSIFTHIDVQHKGEYPYICELCAKGFRRKHVLEHHVKTIHMSERTPCEICGKPLKGMESVKRHRWSHMNQEDTDAAIKAGEKKPRVQVYSSEVHKGRTRTSECPHCDRVYKSKAALKDHIQFTHLGKTVPCIQEGCDEVFRNPNARRLHYLMVHQEARREYQCTLCPRAFLNQSRLKYHVLGMHNIGKKPFQCQDCSKDFANSTKLRYHMKVHSEERAFQCDQCDKGYKGIHNLRKHQEKHHGILP